MNETINTIENEEIGTPVEVDLEVSDFEDDLDISEIEPDYSIAAVLGIGAVAIAGVIGGVNYLKKKKASGDKKEGFIKKIAIKYLTKNGYTVEEPETNEDEETEDDDLYNGFIPDQN